MDLQLIGNNKIGAGENPCRARGQNFISFGACLPLL